MKKTIILIIVLGFMIPGCVYETVDEREIEVGEIYDYEFENDIPEFNNEYDIMDYIYSSSVYIADEILYGRNEYWPTPEEYYLSKNADGKMQGDCDGYSIETQYIIETQLNLRTELAIVESNTSGNITLHTVVHIPSKQIWLDSSANVVYYSAEDLLYVSDYFSGITTKSIKFSISYPEVLWMAVHFHKPVGKYSL